MLLGPHFGAVLNSFACSYFSYTWLVQARLITFPLFLSSPLTKFCGGSKGLRFTGVGGGEATWAFYILCLVLFYF